MASSGMGGVLRGALSMPPRCNDPRDVIIGKKMEALSSMSG
jgi:hypothetical protein